jgi:nucleotide-binding universal stress UspA family protein
VSRSAKVAAKLTEHAYLEGFGRLRTGFGTGRSTSPCLLGPIIWPAQAKVLATGVSDRGGVFMSRILVATAGTEFDQVAVREALGLLGPDHDYLFLTVEHGVTAALAGGGDLLAPAPVPEDVFQDAEQDAKEEGRRSLNQILEDLGLRAEIRVETGDPGERICAVAEVEKVNLIVVGYHHTGVLRRILGGSVSDDVAHHAPCPVLLVRHPSA